MATLAYTLPPLLSPPPPQTDRHACTHARTQNEVEVWGVSTEQLA